MNNYIVCGSKKYENINIDHIVDFFDNIVRHNFLLHNCGYGEKLSTYQVLNGHVYKIFYEDNENVDFCSKKYLPYGIDENIIKNLKSFVDNKNVKFVTFKDNNDESLKKITKINSRKKARCGLSALPFLINKKIKPFLIGYTLIRDEYLDLSNHQVNKGRTAPLNERMHSIDYDIQTIVKLHKMNLIDASFCCIKDIKIRQNNDNENIIFKIDESVIKMTKKSKEILSKFM